MKIENILFEGKEASLKEKIDQLPETFINLNSMKVDVSQNGDVIEFHFEQRLNNLPIVIDIPSTAKDIKITSYGGETFTEFYYKKTNYLLRY